MAVTGRNRWTGGAVTSRVEAPKSVREKFWDYRPFTRIVQSFKAALTLNDYIRINQLEGEGHKRFDARFMIEIEKRFAESPG